MDFPLTWKEFPFQGKKIYLQYSTENSSLEAEADKLLGLSEEDLYHDADETDEDDALAHAEISEELSPPRDEDDDGIENDEEDLDEKEKGPKMFGGKKKKKKDGLH